jgi:triosephosphate isomerase
MRKPFIGGNWKMHGTKASVRDLSTGLLAREKDLSQMDVVVFPPFIFIEEVQNVLTGSGIKYGAQNLAYATEGAFTGEVSPTMLREFGCEYVLVGHSERRALFGETNEMTKQKCQLAQNTGLIPVLCVGETLEQREAHQTEEVIAKQLDAVLPEINMKQCVIAYEPVWAIGTGKTATPEIAQAVHHFIRTKISKIDEDIAKNLRIIYGGSVKAANAKTLFSMPDIDGGLIGGASLNIDEFVEICLCSN